MDLKKPLSIEGQIKKLKEHGMNILNEEDAVLFLERVSYYRFSGYLLQFREYERNVDVSCGQKLRLVIK